MMTAEQLKNSILQLALQGKLVEQRTEEGSARELLHLLSRLKKEYQLNNPVRKMKQVDGIDLMETDVEIPDTWNWVRLQDICLVVFSGKSPIYDKTNTIYKCIGQANNQEKGLDLSSIKYVTEYFHNSVPKYMFLQYGDVLLNTLGGGTVGRAGMVDIDMPDYLTDGHIFVIRTIDPCISKYILFFLRMNRTQIERKANGSTNQSFLKLSEVINYLIPLPPKKEIERIVAKIEELMPFVEQYAAVSTKLNTLNVSFPEMMKKSILQKAVQGKLVPQDPNDEPASLLLKKIVEEKKRLIKVGKIKKGKYDYYIEHRKEGSFCVTHKGMTLIDEMIFDLPDNWTFCTLSELVQFIGGYAYKSNLFVKDSPYQVLRLGNVKNDLLKLDVNPVYITENLAKETQEFLVRHNDILLTMTGTRLKRDYFYTVCVDDSDNSLFVNQRVGCLRPYFGEMSKWLSYVLKSNYVLDFIFNYETGTANQGNLGAENIMKIIIPLPPINEQKRIVKMLDELTAINKDLLIGPLCE